MTDDWMWSLAEMNAHPQEAAKYINELAEWLTSPAGPEPSPFHAAEGEMKMDRIAFFLRQYAYQIAESREGR